MKNFRIISARRAYEFGPDDVRLSMLTLPQVQARIQQTFHFQVAQIGTPAPTFGPVPPTIPPGVIFDFGAYVTDRQEPIPIRFLHFEQRRVVIDIAGRSSTLDDVFLTLQRILDELKSSDGASTLGPVKRVLDYSEVTAELSFSPDLILAPKLRNLLKQENSPALAPSGQVLLPTIIMVGSDPSQEFNGFDQNSFGVYHLALRAGTLPDEKIYFSSAPISSEKHELYLEGMEAALSDG